MKSWLILIQDLGPHTKHKTSCCNTPRMFCLDIHVSNADWTERSGRNTITVLRLYIYVQYVFIMTLTDVFGEP